jgi:RNA 2',3'-cyclic 3'-phosphodiesterase
LGVSGAQSSFPGFEAPATPTDRLFFAIFPDADAAERIAGLAQNLRTEHCLTGKPLAADRFHVTLQMLGDYPCLPEKVVAAAQAAAAAVRMPPFELSFDRAASFSRGARNRPFVLQGSEGVAALMVFQRSLMKALATGGLVQGVAPAYTPHVTLLYDDRLVDQRPIEPIKWTAHEFVLVHSLLRQTRHIQLARWPFTAEPQRDV